MDMYDIGVFSVLTAPFIIAFLFQEILLWAGVITEDDLGPPRDYDPPGTKKEADPS